MNRVCAIVPVYNHPDKLASVVARLLEAKLPVLLVDDGSDSDCKRVLRDLAQSCDAVSLLTRMRNGGKGAAVKSGLRRAYRLGYSHAVQVDADGQHDLNCLPQLLAAGEQCPDAVISGKPVYVDAPFGRRLARYLTHVWIWINTLSFEISDAMCGFRLYPVLPAVNLIEHSRIGRRMDFDPEILVRLHWQGTRIRHIPVAVSYPKDGVSHFRLWRDNWLITLMHTRLFFGMLKRFPLILLRRRRRREN